MELDRAKNIVAAINSFSFSTIGLRSADFAALENVSLMEMVQANEIVCAWNDRPSENGSKTVCIHPDPRLIAAVYCFTNYGTTDRDDDEEDNLIIRADRGGYVEFLLIGRREISQQIDEEEAA